MSDQRRFIVIGASGLIGQALVRAMRASGYPVLPLFRTQPIAEGRPFDMLRQQLADVVTGLNSTDAVMLLAAHSDQAWIARNAVQAAKLNVEASGALARAVAQSGAHLTFMSSESVFGSDCETGWPETSVPNPVTEYGRQKAEMEAVVAKLPNACVVRTGWNVGWSHDTRCVVKTTYEALLGPDAKIATDNVLTLTDVSDTARALVELMLGRCTGIWHLAGGPIRRSELADTIAAVSRFGASMRYSEVKYSSLTFAEPRPARAWLNSTQSLQRLGLAFRASRDIIEDKVRLLDERQPTFAAVASPR